MRETNRLILALIVLAGVACGAHYPEDWKPPYARRCLRMHTDSVPVVNSEGKEIQYVFLRCDSVEVRND